MPAASVADGTPEEVWPELMSRGFAEFVPWYRQQPKEVHSSVFFSYPAGHTWLHRANPVAKLVALFCLSLLVFTLPNPGFQAVLFFLTLAAAAYAGIGGAFWLKKLRFVLFFRTYRLLSPTPFQSDRTGSRRARAGVVSHNCPRVGARTNHGPAPP